MYVSTVSRVPAKNVNIYEVKNRSGGRVIVLELSTGIEVEIVGSDDDFMELLDRLEDTIV